jgi:hypothetical protein
MILSIGASKNGLAPGRYLPRERHRQFYRGKQ